MGLNDKDKDKDKVLIRPNLYDIFQKQEVQEYQISHSDQSTGQLFVNQPDQTIPRLQSCGPNC